MSTKKMASWADNIINAEIDPSGTGSDMPSDDFTWTEGSNYGLDGFHHDQTLGEGTRNRGDQSGMSGPITPAQTSGMSTLPDDFLGKKSEGGDFGEGLTFVDDEGDFDLSAMLSHDEGCLHLADDVRLAASLADLAWLDPTQEQDPERLPKELRQGQPPLNSIPELEDAWGMDRRTDGLHIVPNRDREIAQYEQSIESGLPATPGVEKNANAAWHIKKAVRMSHYGQTMGEIANYLHANLTEAMAKKAVGLVAAEHGVAGNVFVRASAFPGIRNGKWVKELKKFARTARYVITDNPRIASKLSMQMVSEVPYRKALRQYLPGLKAAGYKVAKVGSDAKQTLQLAFLTGPKVAEHVPSTKPVHVQAHERITLAEAKAAIAAAPKKARGVIIRDGVPQARRAALRTVRKAVKAGLISEAQAIKLAQSNASPVDLRRAAERVARSNTKSRTASYSGPIMRQALQQGPKPKKLAADEQEMREASAASGIKVAEFKGMARWARRQMSEGMAGTDLTAMMRIRFPSPLHTAGQDLIAMLRAEHEGLSGHLYVDAEAYASKTGTKGCEKAASKHRANQIRFVRAMGRCSGCVFANADGVCTKYGKELLHELPSDAAKFKQQMIHMADAPDHEITASLFNPGEYNLGDSLSIELDEPAVTEDIGEVLFGGIEL